MTERILKIICAASERLPERKARFTTTRRAPAGMYIKRRLLMEGKIIKGIGGFYYVKTDEGIIECKARGKFRYDSMKPMVGDEVDIDLDKNNKGFIVKIPIRTNRRAHLLFSHIPKRTARSCIITAMAISISISVIS